MTDWVLVRSLPAKKKWYYPMLLGIMVVKTAGVSVENTLVVLRCLICLRPDTAEEDSTHTHINAHRNCYGIAGANLTHQQAWGREKRKGVSRVRF